MAMEFDVSTLAPIISGGGVLAFAWVVLAELKTQRKERGEREVESTRRDETIRELLGDLKSLLSALLERERMRETPARGVPTRLPFTNRPKKEDE